MAETTRRWRIRGAEAETGRDAEIYVTAPDPAGAAARARALGVLSARVEPAPAESPEPESPEPESPERVVRIYATRPRDHLYLGWLLGNRARLILTDKRIILVRRTLLGQSVQTVDIGAVEGAAAVRVVRWPVLILASLLLLTAAETGVNWLRSATGGFAPPPWRTMAIFGVPGLALLLFARVNLLGVVYAGGRFGLRRFRLRTPDIHDFVHTVHCLIRPGVRTSVFATPAGPGDRPGEPACPACGYPLTGLEHARRCPECAQALRD